MNPIVIESLELETVPVTIAGKKFTITELTGKQRDAHLSDVSRRVKYENGAPAGMANFQDLQANLIAQSLRTVNEDGSPGAVVPLATIQGYPARVQEQLAKAIQDISGLNKELEAKLAAAKNGSGASDAPGSA